MILSRPSPALLALLLALGGCTVGPDHVRPASATPDGWGSWRAGDDDLRLEIGTTELPAGPWWRAFGDPVLDGLQQQALAASPDLQTAALHLAQARVQRGIAGRQGNPELGLSAGVTGQRQSEYGASTRLLDAIGGNRDQLVKLLSEPFTLYQAGFDASWELDLWGRVRRSIEASDAEVAQQAALLDLAWLTLGSEVARSYFELRSVQQQIIVIRADVTALQGRVDLLRARVQGGLIDHLNLDQQTAELEALQSQLPLLLAQEAASLNQITLLLGQRPGALQQELRLSQESQPAALPPLALGLPSEVALRRPDIRSAEARLHGATARIGVARADLYPSLRLGGRLGLESYLGGEFAQWGSRTWSVGPTLSLPLFDRGRLKGVVQLRELEQQEAAVNYQRTVLQAWHEIDNALNRYAAEQQRTTNLEAQVRSAGDALALANARYGAGMTDFIAVLDGQRAHLQARRALIENRAQVQLGYVMLHKAIGNVSGDAPQNR